MRLKWIPYSQVSDVIETPSWNYTKKIIRQVTVHFLSKSHKLHDIHLELIALFSLKNGMLESNWGYDKARKNKFCSKTIDLRKVELKEFKLRDIKGRQCILNKNFQISNF